MTNNYEQLMNQNEELNGKIAFREKYHQSQNSYYLYLKIVTMIHHLIMLIVCMFIKSILVKVLRLEVRRVFSLF